MNNPELDMKQKDMHDDYAFPAGKQSPDGTNNSNTSDSHEVPSFVYFTAKWLASCLELHVAVVHLYWQIYYLFQDGFDDLDSLEGSLASFPIKPLQALKYECFYFQYFYLLKELLA